MTHLKLTDLGWQHRPLREAIDQAMRTVIDSGNFILGAEVAEFETAFARYCGATRAVGVDNGSSALELILRALDVGPGHEVIVPAMTFVATASAVAIVGAKPVLVDVDPQTYTIDLTQVRKRVSRATRAVIAVHLHGFPAPIEPLLAEAKGNFHVLEDCCQAHGARVGGRTVGSLGVASAFSFYPSKNLGCFGDGGAVVTSDSQLADRVMRLRNYGEGKKYEHRDLALNRRLDALQAAVLKIKLARLDQWNALRQEAAGRYRDALAGTGLGLPPAPEAGAHAFYAFVVRSTLRDNLAEHLRARGIETGIHYPYPLHRLPVFEDLGYGPGSFPVAERLADEMLSLPMFPGITAEEIARVVSAVKDFQRTTDAVQSR